MNSFVINKMYPLQATKAMSAYIKQSEVKVTSHMPKTHQCMVPHIQYPVNQIPQTERTVVKLVHLND